MNRRSFLRALAIGAVSAATVDVDQILWQPGEKTYFLPPDLPGVQHYGVARFEGDFLAFRRGDVITFDGRYALNPHTGKPTGYLQQFVVMEDTISASSSVVVLRHAPVLKGESATRARVTERMGLRYKKNWDIKGHVISG